MNIHFTKLRYKNLLSSGNSFTEIQLDENDRTLVVGNNGSGKSTMIDAIHFALFNSAYRDINLPQLVNSINKKNCVVEIEFRVGGADYKVVRGIAPKVFEIYRDGVIIPSTAKNADMQKYFEKEILRMDSTTFKQLVLLGTASYVPFMLLKPAKRRELIEELLDIQIIGMMASGLKKLVDTNKIAVVKTEAEMNQWASKIETALEFNKQISESVAKNDEMYQAKIGELQEQVEILKSRRDTLTNGIAPIREAIVKRDKLLEARATYAEQRRDYMHSLSHHEKNATFFLHNDLCPMCKQKIGNEAKSLGSEAEVDAQSFRDKIAKSDDIIAQIDSRLEKYKTADQSLRQVEMRISSVDSEISSTLRQIDSHKKMLEESKKAISPIDNETILGYQNSKINAEKAYVDECNNRKAYAVLAPALKDTGVKAMIVRKYIPIINETINKYLSKLDFFVEFELNEEFEETIKSRYRDVFTYQSFSEGEKAKIDLAIMFTWREVSRRRNSTTTNLLILDEVFDGAMDAESATNLFGIIAENTGSNTFVISHRDAGVFQGFDKTIEFKKVKNFSEMQ